MRIAEVILIGVGATLGIDLWALILRSVFGVRSLDYCMLGRWVLHMPAGKFRHDGIAASPAKAHECMAGWTAHYSIGVVLAAAFVALVGTEWIAKPTLRPALAFGVITVVMPFFVMQPALGLGVASSRAKSPAAARVKSLATHAIFGVGLFAAALLVRRLVSA